VIYSFPGPSLGWSIGGWDLYKKSMDWFVWENSQETTIFHGKNLKTMVSGSDFPN